MNPIIHCEKECTIKAPNWNYSSSFVLTKRTWTLSPNSLVVPEYRHNCEVFSDWRKRWLYLASAQSGATWASDRSQEGQRSGAVIKWRRGFENYNNRAVKVMALTTFADFKWGLMKLMQNDHHDAKSALAKVDHMPHQTFWLCLTKQQTHRPFEKNSLTFS